MTIGQLPSIDPNPPPTSQPTSRLRSHWGLVVSVALGLVAYGGMLSLDASSGTLRDRFTSQTIGWYLLAFAGFALALWWNERHPIDRRWLWAVPIVFRILLLATTPTLSDDVHRYLWDGHVATEGVNPYSHAIDAPELDEYEIPARALANNPSLGTPYLPTAQLVFASSALLMPSEPITMQLVMVAFDLMAALLIVRLLRLVEIPDRRVLVYLWNPLVIVEVAHGAHVDALMVMLSLWAVVLSYQRTAPRRQWAAPTVLAAATLTRLLPIVLLPVLWWRWTWPQRLTYGAVSAAMLLPFGLGAGWGLTGERTGTGVFGSIRVYGSDWAFNAGIHRWLEAGLGRVGVAHPDVVARWVVVSVMAGVLVVVWRRARQISTIGSLRLMATPLMAFVLLSPTVHPWYMLMLVAWLPLLTPTADEPSRRWLQLTPWLYLSAVFVFSYLTYRDPRRFAELEWVRVLEWLPTMMLLAAVGFVGRMVATAPRPMPTGPADEQAS
jgi:hypothetical protein